MSTEDSKSVLDMAMIEGLRQLQIPDKPDFLSFLVGVFMETSQEHASKIRQAAKAKDFGLLNDMSHSLKSSAANLGAHRLATVCQDLERLGEKRDLQALEFTMQMFDREFDAAVQALTKFQKAS